MKMVRGHASHECSAHMTAEKRPNMSSGIAMASSHLMYASSFRVREELSWTGQLVVVAVNARACATSITQSVRGLDAGWRQQKSGVPAPECSVKTRRKFGKLSIDVFLKFTFHSSHTHTNHTR